MPSGHLTRHCAEYPCFRLLVNKGGSGRDYFNDYVPEIQVCIFEHSLHYQTVDIGRENWRREASRRLGIIARLGVPGFRSGLLDIPWQVLRLELLPVSSSAGRRRNQGILSGPGIDRLTFIRDHDGVPCLGIVNDLLGGVFRLKPCLAGKAHQLIGGIPQVAGGKLKIFFPVEHHHVVPDKALVVGHDDSPLRMFAPELSRAAVVGPFDLPAVGGKFGGEHAHWAVIVAYDKGFIWDDVVMFHWEKYFQFPAGDLRDSSNQLVRFSGQTWFKPKDPTEQVVYDSKTGNPVMIPDKSQPIDPGTGKYPLIPAPTGRGRHWQKLESENLPRNIKKSGTEAWNTQPGDYAKTTTGLAPPILSTNINGLVVKTVFENTNLNLRNVIIEIVPPGTAFIN